ncbi:BamA/TamA family outer membrane protein [Photobacterium sp. OFAV2-7]|uniref:BamA/TamA family outer membrane protein n=1 Tax=Photobacterium sp. OFAV2-7 TaxID=2917748 RepID=UPI001EF51B85|nr:BamA/TamA family outer membrane protein [Photobacterium sp. OFAV2-7]MCG7587601.1 outer membrane protein assembly factor [Photobacterium sp. OFAV2-7]
MLLKKTLTAAAVIAGLTSGMAIADEPASKEDQGVRFTVPVGPFYDPIFDLAGSVIPTLTYETTPGAKTSKTSFYGIYGTNGNWVTKVASDTYFGSNSDWYLFADATYTYAKLDVENFMRFFGIPGISDAPVVEVEQNTIRLEGALSYQFAKDLYIGPSAIYISTEFERDSSHPFSTVNMITDKETTGYGIALTYDKRNNTLTPTNGFYVDIDAKMIEEENEGGAAIPAIPGLLPGGFTLNGTNEYDNVQLDLRYYQPFSDATTLAWRAKADWNSDDATETTTNISNVAHGFTMEVGGRSAIGTDFQLRHWVSDKVGVVGMVSVAQPIDNTSGEDDVHYAGGLGVRYMLVPEDKLSMRLDVTYNDQEDDNVLVFFNVGETF